ncbi:ATPase, T2SS/T4P/T4SS family [Cohnella lubricantis]|uniref:Flp pilus assembly complex ATPase component TadA n=1 Tax=Cohnella lubricantis TaxID=2163172 RepID=A0A841TER5_9BACL|nr:ATPase, T2SS/T4P/T4SS family [Cohnella lubricantis]MBB6679522.1 Flp pilus assembly complex ATPase component TadA [Cohnella lubricantis]MBP2119258.1 type IV pilus assembly protein PilB [Cohnella lubricantis]
MRIGELLVMNGLITDEQLEQALEEQRNHPAKLGEILVGQQFITERQLAEALEFQLGVPVANMSEAAFDSAAVQLIPESLARKHRVLPIGRDGSKLRVAMLDPLDHEAVKQIQMASGLHVLPMIAIRTEMDEAIVRYYGSDESAEELTRILQAGIESKAEGIHLEAAESGLYVRLRVGDALQDHGRAAKLLQPALVGRIKRLAGLAAEGTDKPSPQTGRFQTDVDHKPVEIRVSTLPTMHGEDLYLLLADPYSPLLKLSELDIGESNLQEIEKALNEPGGLLIVSGPRAAGRTSTAYSLMEHNRADDRKTVSVEDPITRVMPGFTQVEVHEQTGFTMARALRAALRHKPDLVMVDGLPDGDTVETALLASRYGGPKIIGTMTARSAIDTLRRLLAMERDADLLASSIACIVAQRLVRRVCRQCVQTVPATDEEIRRFQEAGLLSPEDLKNAAKGTIGNFRLFVYTHISGKPAVARGAGCRACGHTGYRDRIAVQEVLTIDDTLRKLIAERRPIAEIEKHAQAQGHKSLLHDGLAKAREGLTTVEEVLQATT